MKAVTAAQLSAEWFAARRGLPTCSVFDKIITPKKGERSASQDGFIDQLIAEAICPPSEGVERHQSADMEYGMRLEAEARCSYELEHAKGETVTEVGFLLHDSGLFGGSPDALVGEAGGVEIKCPAPATHIGYARAGILPFDYRCQVHGHLIVTGRAWWDFYSYARGFTPFRVRVTRDDFTAKLQAELLAFCQRYNEARKQFELPPLPLPVAA